MIGPEMDVDAQPGLIRTPSGTVAISNMIAITKYF